MIDPKLHSLIKVVETGSFTRAAEQLYISQPALSKAVKHLEEELGAKLLVQGDKRSEPTDVGRVLFETENSEILENILALHLIYQQYQR